MIFNPDISKQAQEVVFSRKSDKVQTSQQKHLGLYLDEKLNFNHHTKEVISKVNEGIGIIRKLRSILSRNALLIIYKAFIRPNIGYCHFIYEQPHNESFCNNLEKLQYNAALAVTGAIKGISKLKIYEELGLESSKFRRWMRRLSVFYKIKTLDHLEYLYKLIPAKSSYNTRNLDHIETCYCRKLIFLNIHSFLIQLWNGTEWTTPCVIQNPTIFLRIHY